MKRITAALFIGLGLAALSTAQAQQTADGTSFRQEGIASWYGTEFDGRPTASGEIFNAALFTAAHPTLPFGTVLTVTNRHNNKTVSVRVNDRGPFVSARIIDLSRAAAEQLDMLATGTAPVVIEGATAVRNQGASPQYTTETSSQAVSEGSWASASSQISAPAEPVVVQQFQPQVQQTQQVQPVQQVHPIQQYQPIPPQPPVQQYQPVVQPQQPVQQIIQPVQPVQPQQQQPVQQIVQPVQPQPQPPILQIQVVQQPQQPAPQAQTVEITIPAPPVEEVKPAIAPAYGKIYRIQVGSYKVARNAVEAFDRLKRVGLNPVYERNGENFRVVLSGVRAEDVESVTQRIGAAGFRDPLLRAEN
ncbi:hypothetical protein AGMMS49587_09730 [Spirochaetia bacterium]|nr:hypothetical protein AGMMS49587_09730 [Spirochaetia bacterium]